MNGVRNGAGAAGGIREILDMRRQIVERSDSLRTLTQAVQAPEAAPSAPEGGGFAGALKGAVEQVNAAQVRSSDITAAYERGEVVDVAQVMLARQEAGVAFEATLQVRNKLLSAYQDIMRMGV